MTAWYIAVCLIMIALAWVIWWMDRRDDDTMRPGFRVKLRDMMTGVYFTEVVIADDPETAKQLAIRHAAKRGVRAATVSLVDASIYDPSIACDPSDPNGSA